MDEKNKNYMYVTKNEVVIMFFLVYSSVAISNYL